MTIEIPAGLQAALADRYRIERSIGQGGMATVYLAHDLKHDRRVALKILRPELAAVIGASRFLAEIKVTANLQHPHILPLHDSGEAAGTVFYVMPLVDGESLRDRISREHQLPVPEALRIAKEVASALDYAHRQGVVHRDIKPENILLHDGQAMIADFGIALAVSRTDGASRMTETGMSLGTPHYMAPEQAMGEREISARADVYALGAVLYEMLLGEPPFTGGTAQAVVARALTEVPRSVVAQRHTVPVHVEATVLRALEKLPADRFASAAEFAAALDDPTRMPATHVGMVAAPRRADPWRWVLGATTLGAAAVGAWLALRPPEVPSVVRVPMSFPRELEPLQDRQFAVSPDGEWFGYIAANGDNRRILVLKRRDAEQGQAVPASLGVLNFAFSPDSRWLAMVVTGNILLKWPVAGGPAVELARRVSAATPPAWMRDGSVMYRETGSGALLVMRVGATDPERLWPRDSVSNFVALTPVEAADTRVLFGRCVPSACPQTAELVSLDLETRDETVVMGGAYHAMPAGPNRWLFLRVDGSLLAAPYDVKEAKILGTPTTVVDSIGVAAGGAPLVSASASGDLYYRRGDVQTTSANYELVYVERDGTERRIDSTFVFRHVLFGGNAGWRVSPDGRRVVIGLNTQAGDNIWIKDLPQGPLARISFDSAPGLRPQWSRDGRHVYYIQRSGGTTLLLRRLADGTGRVDTVFTRAERPGIFEFAVEEASRTLVFRDGGTVAVTGGRDIKVASLDSGPARPIIASTEFDESGLAMAPDFRLLAYESNENGRTEVYVRPFPAVDAGRWQASISGGRAPAWSRDGRELFFVDEDRYMNAVAITRTATGAPQLSAPRRLFAVSTRYYLTAQENYTPWDLTPDGRFVVARRVEEATRPAEPIVAALHFVPHIWRQAKWR